MPSTLYNPEDEQKESRERTVGIISTVIVHALIILLLFFMGIYKPYPPLEEEKGIPVQFGNMTTGSGNVVQETATPAAQPASAPVQTQPQPTQQEEATKAPEKVVTQDNEEAPVALRSSTKKSVSKPQPVNETPKPVTAAKPPTPVVPAPQPAPGTMMGKYTGTNKPGSNGNDNTLGNKGVPWGTTGNVYSGPNGTGTIPGGEGGGSGDYNLRGRKMMKPPQIIGDIQESGTVVVSITVDRKGNVTGVDCCQAKGTTTANPAMINKAMEAAHKIKFDANADAPDQQSGTVTFRFKLQ